jgi:hypothetical protein
MSSSPGRPPRPRREEAEEIAERRDKVRSLLTRQQSHGEIAQNLGVSRLTIERDIAVLKEQSRKSLYSLAKNDLPWHFDLVQANVGAIMKEAWTVYRNADNDKSRIGALRVILDAQAEYYAMLRSGPGVLSMSAIDQQLNDLRQQLEQYKSRVQAAREEQQPRRWRVGSSSRSSGLTTEEDEAEEDDE